MNYNELKQAIQDYAENQELSFVTNIPTFIKQAEHRIYNSVQLPIFKKTMTGFATVSNPYVSCPDDFLAVYSIATVSPAGVYSFLIDKDVSYLREAYPSSTTTGAPRYYALFGPQSASPKELALMVAPTPSTNFSVEMQYYYYPTSIADTLNNPTGTSWLGDNYDPILLYGALREAIIYMKGDQDMVSYYEQKFQEALSQLKRLGDGLQRGDAYRGGQVKIPEKSL